MSMEIGGNPFFNKYYNSLKKLSMKTYFSSLAHHIFSNVGYINTSNSRALKSTIIDIDLARQQHQSSPHEPQSRTNLPLHLTLEASVHDDPSTRPDPSASTLTYSLKRLHYYPRRRTLLK
ncbi:hypothetical protein DPMN_003173 [Dreissena polymorpha]|uniref:Uncharacterized protein n=1 Tax=Dreissena polymorpha TaxID=45954 RepID=A0A9D4RUH4_DREPO|nr:hypothetical protein DPMN_003173 [Dreissena polymorpha]